MLKSPELSHNHHPSVVKVVADYGRRGNRVILNCILINRKPILLLENCMGAPRINLFLFILYSLLSMVVFLAALFSPLVRQYSPAPLRDLILPPPAPVVVTLLYSTEKESWLMEMIPLFEQSQARVNGRPIKIITTSSGSREMVFNILEGKQQPVLFSPASSLQVSILEDLSNGKFGYPLVNKKDKNICKPVLKTPLILAAWRERANILWGNEPGLDVWERIHKAVVDPKGWATLGQPDWGYVKFGHTSPLTSNSGLMTLLLMTYDFNQKTNNLTSADILSNSDYQKWLIETESTISQFGDSTGSYMKDMISYGPSAYDIVAVYESTAIENADNAVGRYGELFVYYPPATILSDHPFCVLQADWVKPEETQAANLFIDFLLSRPAQETALLKYGFRPVDNSIPLDMSGSPLNRYASNGLKTNLPPEIEVPPGNVLNTLIDFWTRSIPH